MTWSLLTRIAERTLGLGVTSARSSLGRRIQQVLRGERGRSLSNMWRLAIAGGLALAALAVAVTLFFPPPVPGFSWAKAQGWNMQPVRVVSLQPAWLGRLEGMPPSLSAHDWATIYACGRTHEWPSGSQTMADRHIFEQAVAQYPHAFYPEYCLGVWYQVHHQLARYQDWERRALHDAPRVLAGRIAYADGKPVADATLRIMLDTFDSHNLSVAHAITYQWETTTNEAGCYYLPVFNGVYSIPWGPGFNGGIVTDARGQRFNVDVSGGKTSDYLDKAIMPSRSLRLGMVAPAHVSILPQITARSPIAFVSQAGQSQGSEKHPILIRGNTLDLAWKPVQGANLYSISIQAIPHNPFVNSVLYTSSLQRSSQETHMSIRLDGTGDDNSSAPLFDRSKVYLCTVSASRSVDDHLYLVDTSATFYFSPANAVAPLTLTPAVLAQHFGVGTVVTSITDKHGIVTISGTAPKNILQAMDAQDTLTTVGRLFGLTLHEAACGPVDDAPQGTFQATYYR